MLKLKTTPILTFDRVEVWRRDKETVSWDQREPICGKMRKWYTAGASHLSPFIVEGDLRVGMYFSTIVIDSWTFHGLTVKRKVCDNQWECTAARALSPVPK